LTNIEPSRLDELHPNPAITQLVYGSSGVGKTHYAGTAGDRTVYINTGDGIATLQSAAYKEKYKSNPYIVTIHEDVDQHGVPKTANAFDNVADTLEHWFTKRLSDFDTIVIDDLTWLSQFAAYKAMELGGRLRGSKTLATARAGRHLPIKEQSDWGIEIDALKHFINTVTAECKITHKHFLVLAHERKYWVKVKGSNDPSLRLIAPLVAGKDTFGPDQLPGMFDLVWHFSAESSNNLIVTKARTNADGRTIAKSRWGGIFTELEKNPLFPNVVERIHKSTKGEK
jgi:hypothetical protein